MNASLLLLVLLLPCLVTAVSVVEPLARYQGVSFPLAAPLAAPLPTRGIQPLEYPSVGSMEVIPHPVFTYLEMNYFGDFHMIWHMSRRYYKIGGEGHDWLGRLGGMKAMHQEGEAYSGIEFLAMNRALLQSMQSRFRHVPEFVGYLGQDADTDEDMANVMRSALLAQARLDVRPEVILASINDFAHFATDDQFGIFLRTRVEGDQRPGAGIHNFVHTARGHPGFVPDMGNYRTAVLGANFWRFHAWIDGKWQQYEAFHEPRSGNELLAYTTFMDAYTGLFASLFPSHTTGAAVLPKAD